MIVILTEEQINIIHDMIGEAAEYALFREREEASNDFIDILLALNAAKEEEKPIKAIEALKEIQTLLNRAPRAFEEEGQKPIYGGDEPTR